MTASPVEAPAGAFGLLSAEEAKEALRAALGESVADQQLDAAIAALHAAEAARWEVLPPDINPDMGYNFQFLSCSETCWLGRPVLIDGATFRVYRLREEPADETAEPAEAAEAVEEAG
jgi:hypothetical protein